MLLKSLLCNLNFVQMFCSKVAVQVDLFRPPGTITGVPGTGVSGPGGSRGLGGPGDWGVPGTGGPGDYALKLI